MNPDPFILQSLERIDSDAISSKIIHSKTITEHELKKLTLEDNIFIDKNSKLNFDQDGTNFNKIKHQEDNQCKTQADSHLTYQSRSKIEYLARNRNKNRSRPKIQKDITSSKSFNYFGTMKLGKNTEKSIEIDRKMHKDSAKERTFLQKPN